jgi:hypothetical protein
MAEFDSHDPRLLSGDVDFYCLECGYNLRGLAGDPKRCPECFYANPIGDLAVTAKDINRQLRRLETGPTGCVAGLLFLAVGLFALFVAWWPPSLLVCTVGVVAWAAGARTFRDSCRGQAGWLWALLRFQLYGLGIIVLGLAVPAACMVAVVELLERANVREFVFCVVYPIVTALSFALVCRLICVPLYRLIRRELHQRQRVTAVIWARQFRRETVARQMNRRNRPS